MYHFQSASTIEAKHKHSIARKEFEKILYELDELSYKDETLSSIEKAIDSEVKKERDSYRDQYIFIAFIFTFLLLVICVIQTFGITLSDIRSFSGLNIKNSYWAENFWGIEPLRTDNVSQDISDSFISPFLFNSITLIAMIGFWLTLSVRSKNISQKKCEKDNLDIKRLVRIKDLLIEKEQLGAIIDTCKS
ncbi:hypothetical protein [Photobacterium leiognathi]|uniref:hypothetical protein n=1 Tax=Photobacterium leiognathi TaxID=553611 RepID=UPI0029815DD5|nr:hypothetical protein [Photobacterium leiognathi]